MYIGELPPFLLAIDTETSGVCKGGVDPSEGYQILSYGALIIDSSTFETVDQLYVEIMHDPKFKWEDGAYQIHGLSQEYLAANGVSLQDGAMLLLSLITKYMGQGMSVVPCGHRIKFDVAFVNRMLAEAECEIWWDRCIIDSAAMGGAFLNITGSEALFEAVGLPPRQKHNALEDITYTVQAIKVMREMFLAGLEATAWKK